MCRQGQAQKAAAAGPLHVMLEVCAAACLPREGTDPADSALKASIIGTVNPFKRKLK
jgi:hypothetical protein